MTLKRTLGTLVIVVMALTGGATPVRAEWSWDLYGGVAWLQSADLKVSGRGTDGASANATIFDLEADTGFTVGTRVGYWFGFAPFLGLGLDAFYMQFEVPAQSRTGTGTFTGEFLDRPISLSASGVASIPSSTLPVFGFAPELRLRWPLMVDATFTHGRLQPYIAGGPSWAFSLENDSVTLQFGGKVGGGIAFHVTPLLAFFSEYRYIFYPDFKFTDRNISYKADVDSHTVVVGISLRF
jgi:opacity protein-like surface antigen